MVSNLSTLEAFFDKRFSVDHVLSPTPVKNTCYKMPHCKSESYNNFLHREVGLLMVRPHPMGSTTCEYGWPVNLILQWTCPSNTCLIAFSPPPLNHQAHLGERNFTSCVALGRNFSVTFRKPAPACPEHGQHYPKAVLAVLCAGGGTERKVTLKPYLGQRKT